jgi:hypothetical protein
MARKTSNGAVLFHLIFGLVTGGIWWLFLAIKFVVSNSK